jgi:hypothetical protein
MMDLALSCISRSLKQNIRYVAAGEVGGMERQGRETINRN